MAARKPEEFATGGRVPDPSHLDQRHPHARRARPSQGSRFTRPFMAILGAIPFVWGSVAIALHYPSTKWPSTEGKIVSQFYREFPYNLRHHIRPAQLEIRYAYTVAGIAYESERFSLWHAIYQDSDGVVRAFAERHRRDTPITVYYEPGNPKKAVLQTGPDWRGDFSLIVFGAFLSWIAFLMHMVSVRRRRRGPARLQSRS